MRLRPEVRKAAEEKLKRPIPEPDEPGFYALLEEVRVSDPELAALLEEGIEFEQVKPPEEEVRQEVRKRALLRDLYNRLLNRYDELTGEWVPSRPKQILVGVGALLGLVVFMWSMNSLGGHKPKRAAPATATASQVAPAQQSHLEAPAPPPQGPVEGSAASPQEEKGPQGPSQGGAAGGPPAQDQAPGQSAAGAQDLAGSVPPPPTPAPTGEVPPPPAPSGTYPAGASVAQADFAPAMTLYLRPAAQEGTAPAPGLALYARSGGGEEGAEKGPTLAIPLSGGGGGAQAQAQALALYTRSSEDKGQVPPTTSFAAYQKREAPQAQASQASPPPPPAASGPGLFESNLPEVFGRGQGAPGAPPSGGTNGAAPGVAVAAPYLPGTRLPGRLAVKLVVPEGQEVPVALETKDGATFLGKAKLSPTRRVEVNLDQAVLAGKVYPLKAVILGADLAQGLPAQVREEAPSLAADLVRGSLRGLSDYVRARSQQTTVTTTPSGTVIQQGQAPPLELFLGAAAADLFSVPEGTRAVVRVAEVAEGTPLTVLVLGAGQ